MQSANPLSRVKPWLHGTKLTELCQMDDMARWAAWCVYMQEQRSNVFDVEGYVINHLPKNADDKAWRLACKGDRLFDGETFGEFTDHYMVLHWFTPACRW